MAKIKMVKVESSNLDSVGYDEKKSELYITFKSKSTYKYLKVPKEKFDGILEAVSPGKFFIAKIKGLYTFKKLGEDD